MTLERFSEIVAGDIEDLPSESFLSPEEENQTDRAQQEIEEDLVSQPQAGGQIIEMLMQLIMSLLSSCPASDRAIAEEVKSPSRRSKAIVRAVTTETCKQCFLARFAPKSWQISEALVKHGQSLTLEEAVEVVRDARNPNFLVV